LACRPAAREEIKAYCYEWRRKMRLPRDITLAGKWRDGFRSDFQDKGGKAATPLETELSCMRA